MNSNVFETGVFLEECKNRFRCLVKIRDKEEICYLSSSSKLTPFIQLQGREVLLVKNLSSKSKSAYTVHAVKSDTGYILLNLGHVNTLLMTEFEKPGSLYAGAKNICREKIVHRNHRADFYIEQEQRTVIEAKGLITEKAVSYLPSMNVERAVTQLKIFKKLLKAGCEVHYYLVLMNPAIGSVKLDKARTDYYKEFRVCIKSGMKCFIYRVKYEDKHFFVVRDIDSEEAFLSACLRKQEVS